MFVLLLFMLLLVSSLFFFFNDTATTEIYTLSLHDALPICRGLQRRPPAALRGVQRAAPLGARRVGARLRRSEEHTSELQSRSDLVCRLLLEKKKLKPTEFVSNLRIDYIDLLSMYTALTTLL